MAVNEIYALVQKLEMLKVSQSRQGAMCVGGGARLAGLDAWF